MGDLTARTGDLSLFLHRARDFVRRSPVTCAPDVSAMEVARRLSREGVGSIVVVDPDGAAIGIVNGVVTPSYMTWATSPSTACSSVWQWSLQMPGLSATNAMSYDSPSATLSESTHQVLPVAGTPLRLSTTAW